MKLRFMSIFAAAAMLAACESAPESGATQASTASAPAAAKPSIVPGSEQDFIANVGDRVFFDYDKFALRADAKAGLDKQVAWLKKYPTYKMTIEGHADERGTREYNLALGERRANAVKDYMVGAGIAKDRVKTISYGKERPVALGSNEAAWSQNRRGVTVLGK
ncbi:MULTISPECIES: peptidoglycan-associated lipoprotein Pal [Magnetospirillum]|uniref:Peptidoglycan-associated lipoprotein n=1 Tax=Magnetospirillum moscoviense TaxID=1437059 RepID=A0A178MZI7_9PROT|nr:MULTISPECIES: peptidoglycan-associated lipoprotein Pal [Magnetospirillum]MBF0323609.1 peptidoglycan-associated lipoprotein Pal [Alphaproteobacteria bacterium]OAN64469.1 peptidoglycan-associated lipoprotein [Magnetospirillum moscoviense]CAA7612063.1 Outer membrane lipoprotein Omp16 homolog [Magnetospirillum sp. LM-5]